jgi:trehalose 6-phosphate phosphatase
MKHCLSALDEISAVLRSASRVLIACDFDGTLCPIADSPDDVVLAPTMSSLLRFMSASNRMTLAVISGRLLADIAERCPRNVVIGGNHGLQLCGRGICFEHREAASFQRQIAVACEELQQVICAWPGAWVEDKRLTATVHYRRVLNQRPGLLFAVKKRLSQIALGLFVREGKDALDVLPCVDWDKGSALRYILQEAGPFEACICLGDDLTDEAMFRSNCSQLNIVVGKCDNTGANYYLSGPEEVECFLRDIAAWKGSHSPYEGLLRAWGPDSLGGG